MGVTIGFLAICIIAIIGVLDAQPQFKRDNIKPLSKRNDIKTTNINANRAKSWEDYVSLSNRNIEDNKNKLREFTFLVSVRQNGKHICQGAQYNKNLIIVPAHCVKCGSDSNSQKLNILTNTNNFKDENSGKLYSVSKILCNKNVYNPNDDIALLKVSKNIEENPLIQKHVQLPVDPMEQLPSGMLPTDEFPARNKVYAIGWNLMNDGSIIPNKIETNYLSEDKCFNADGKLAGSKRLCTPKQNGFDICMGNNDAMLISGNDLIGIATKNSCGSKLNVFTRVSQYKNFFMDVEYNDE